MQLSLQQKNPISRYAKLNHAYFCATAYEAGDIKSFLRHYFSYIMDRNGSVAFDEPIEHFISCLTGWKNDSIRRSLKAMASYGEIIRPKDDDTRLTMNDFIFNRQGRVMNRNMPYEGKDPSYNDRQLRIITHMNKQAGKPDEGIEQAVIDANERLIMENQELRREIERLRGQNEGMEKALQTVLKTESSHDASEAPVLSIVRESKK